MRLSSILLALWSSLFLYAQAPKNDTLLAYHYGAMIGYEWQALQLDAATSPMAALEAGVLEVYEAEQPISAQRASGDLNQLKATWTPTALEDAAALDKGYGLVIGWNWKELELAPQAANFEAFKAGLKSVLEAEQEAPSPDRIQTVVLEHYQGLMAERSKQKAAENKLFLAENSTKAGILVLENGIQYEVLQTGKGDPVGTDKKAFKIYYKGMLTDGTIFESVTKPSAPLQVNLNGVLPGWQSLLPLLHPNETIRAYIPPQYGYGNQAHGTVPPHSILVYELTLVGVVD